MVDRKKVIKGLKMCIANDTCDECPYEEQCVSIDQEYEEPMMRDVLELLKEQEAVEPYVDGEGNYCCKVCDTVVGWEELTDAGLTPCVYKFCPECGRAVKWE